MHLVDESVVILARDYLKERIHRLSEEYTGGTMSFEYMLGEVTPLAVQLDELNKMLDEDE